MEIMRRVLIPVLAVSCLFLSSCSKAEIKENYPAYTRTKIQREIRKETEEIKRNEEERKMEKIKEEEKELREEKPINYLDNLVELSFRDTSAIEVLEYLDASTELNFIILDRNNLEYQKEVTLSYKTSLENALNLITEMSGLSWKLDKGLIKIGKPESVNKYEMRIYDVKDLLLHQGDFSVGSSGGGSSRSGNRNGGIGRGISGSYNSSNNRAGNLILLLKGSCGYGTWQDYSDGVIDVGGGRGNRSSEVGDRRN